MATFEIPIFNGLTKPDTSGDVFQEPYSIKGGSPTFDPLPWIFNNSGAVDDLDGYFDVPVNYNAGAQAVVIWTSATTTGDVDLDFLYRAVSGSDIELMNGAATETVSQDNNTGPSVAQERMVTVISLTAGNFSAQDSVPWRLRRDSLADTKTAAIIVFSVLFRYTD